MDIIQEQYTRLCRGPSDIYEHLPTLKHYAQQCDRILETGVRGCVSSWALTLGLLENPSPAPKYLLLNDISVCNVAELTMVAETLPQLQLEQRWCNNLDLELAEPVDLVFIDTWHVYGQLKRELAKFAPLTRRWIIMHDTTVDGESGESLRMGYDIPQQMVDSGFPREEIEKGLRYAIEEFLAQHPTEWKVRETFHNNNGLTVLERCGQPTENLDGGDH